MLAGRIRDTARLEVRAFGLSVVGGDLKDDPNFRDSFLDKGLDQHGWVSIRDSSTSKWRKDPDLTLPVAWVVGIESAS